MNTPAVQDVKQSLHTLLAPYKGSNRRRSLWQAVNTLVPYITLWVLMFLSLKVSYWLTLALAVPTAGFMVRTFILFHDCGHGSFFKSARANTIVGIITGFLTFTPYHQWRYQHALHHGTAGNLDRRGQGDVWTMTVEEFLQASSWKRFTYRIYRHPFFMLFFGHGDLFKNNGDILKPLLPGCFGKFRIHDRMFMMLTGRGRLQVFQGGSDHTRRKSPGHFQFAAF